jgi:hypothetical protein
MEDIVTKILGYIFTDPTKVGMVGLMLLITIGALWLMYHRDKEHKEDVKELMEQANKLNEENKKDLLAIIEKYQAGQLSVVQTMNELKLLLVTIVTKI